MKYNDNIWYWVLGSYFVEIRSPSSFFYFSERMGFEKPIFSLLGWRLFVGTTGGKKRYATTRR